MGPEDHHEPPLDPEAYELWMIETRNAAILDEIEKLSNGEIQCDSTNELEAADVACQRVVKLVQELRFSLPAYARGCQWKSARPSKEAPAPLDTEVIEANLADYARRYFGLFNMYMMAWLREMGGVIRPKFHQIDGFVLRARDIYEKAQLVDRIKQIMLAELEKKSTAEELFDAVFKMLAENGKDKVPTN